MRSGSGPCGDHMMLPAATLFILLAQPQVAADAGTPPRVSALPVQPAPGLPRVMVERGPRRAGGFRRLARAVHRVALGALADPGDDGKVAPDPDPLRHVTQIHRVGAPLGMREQLTFGKEPVARRGVAAGRLRGSSSSSRTPAGPSTSSCTGWI